MTPFRRAKTVSTPLGPTFVRARIWSRASGKRRFRAVCSSCRPARFASRWVPTIAATGSSSRTTISTTQGSSFLDQAIGLFPSGNTHGTVRAQEAYGELLIPLLGDLPFVEKLELIARCSLFELQHHGRQLDLENHRHVGTSPNG